MRRRQLLMHRILCGPRLLTHCLLRWLLFDGSSAAAVVDAAFAEAADASPALWGLRLRWRLLMAQRLPLAKQILPLLAQGQLLPLHGLLLLGQGLALLPELLLL
jgi:hypothetical protein